MEPIENTILVVEDHRIYQELIRAILADGGYQTTMVESMEEAKNLCGLPFAAMTLDLKLRDASGFQALVELRALFPQTPIIVVAGSVSEWDVFELIRRGADSCIKKPFHNGDVLLHVRRAIEMRDEMGRYTQFGRMARALRMI